MPTAAHLIDQWVRIWNTYDLNAIDQLFLTDARLSYISSEKRGVLRGFEAVYEHHRGFGFVAGGKASQNRLWLEEIEYDSFGEITIATGTWLFQRPNGPIQRGPVTFICVMQADDTYRFAHLNFANERA